MKSITINRNAIAAELRSAYRLSLSNRALYHTVYLYDDGTTYDFTDASGNSWMQGGGIVATIASYSPDVSGSCVDAYLYGLSAEQRIDLYKDYMTQDEIDAFAAAVSSGEIADIDDVCEVDDWVQSHTGAYDKVREEAYDWEVGEADSNGDFDAAIDEAVSELESNGYKIVDEEETDTKTLIFVGNGITVYVEDGIVHEATDAEDIEIGEDTESNRASAIADAKATINAWKA